MENKINIVEKFLSIQGEGIHSGIPTYFIRLAGCNLRCSFCDTKYSYGAGKEEKISEIIKEVKKQPFKLICLTGGEPLWQKNSKILIDELIKSGYKIDIETNGSIPINKLKNSPKILFSMDIKCPSSGMSFKNNYANLKYLGKKDQLKFVIGNLGDYVFAKKVVGQYSMLIKTNIVFTPVDGIKAKKLVAWILRDGLNIRIGLQIHKVIWKTEREELAILNE
jgi:7-carboxy-7-deazaguanine synthase